MSRENIQDKEKAHNQIKQEKTEELTKKQLILYSIMIGGTITIAILAMIGVNLFALLIIIGIVLVYVYLDDDIRKGDISESSEVNKEINEK
jgi:1,4-dihydroxy-2-naphthoate octaprenyltransferase